MKRYLLHAIFAIMLLVPNSALAVTAATNPFAGTYTGTVSINGGTAFSYDLTLGTDGSLMTLGDFSGYMFVPSSPGTTVFPAHTLGITNDPLTVVWNSITSNIIAYSTTTMSDYFDGEAAFADLVGGVYRNFIFQGTGSIKMDDVSIYASFSRTPIPGAVWLLGSGLAGLIGLRRRMNRA